MNEPALHTGEHFWRRAFRATGPLLLWAAHFFACYVAIAVGCDAAAAGASDGTPAIDGPLRGGLVVATLAAVAIEALWVAAERRRQRRHPNDGLAGPMALGSAALAIVAMLWLLAAVLSTPMCRAS